MKFCRFEKPYGSCKLFGSKCNPSGCSKKDMVEVAIADIIDNKEERMNDNVNHPSHYTQGGIECIDAIEAAVSELSGIEAVCTGNAIKYLWRWKKKNGVEDLKKARWYINRLIEREKRNDGKRA